MRSAIVNIFSYKNYLPRRKFVCFKFNLIFMTISTNKYKLYFMHYFKMHGHFDEIRRLENCLDFRVMNKNSSLRFCRQFICGSYEHDNHITQYGIPYTA